MQENTENNNLPKPVVETEMKETGNVSGVYSFKSMYDALPAKVSNNMAKNLSAPIAFVTLLYLANEKVTLIYIFLYRAVNLSCTTEITSWLKYV